MNLFPPTFFAICPLSGQIFPNSFDKDYKQTLIKHEGESVSIYAVLRACWYTLDKLHNTVQIQPAATSSQTECLEGKGAIIHS